MGHDPFHPLSAAHTTILCLPATPLPPHRLATIIAHLNSTSNVIRKTDVDAHVDGLGTPTFDAILGTVDRSAEWLICGFTASSEVGRREFWEGGAGRVVLGLAEGEDADEEVRGRWEGSVSAYFEGVPSCLVVVEPSASEKMIDGTDDADEDASVVRLDLAASRNGVLDRVVLGMVRRSAQRAREYMDAHRAELPIASGSLGSDELGVAEARLDSNMEGGRGGINGTSKTVTPQPGLSQPGSAQVTDTVGKAVAQGLIMLQEGNWANAFNQLRDAARLAKDYNEPAWHARALEGLVVCILLQAWAGHDWTVPLDCLPSLKPNGSAISAIAEMNRSLNEKYGKATVGNWQVLTAILPGLVAAVVRLYELAAERGDLPWVLAIRAKIRLVSVLVELRRHGSVVNKEFLERLVRRVSSSEPQTVTTPLVLRQSQLAEVLVEAANHAQARLSCADTIAVLAAVSQVCGRLGLDRKQGFYLKEILQKILPLWRNGNQEADGNSVTAASIHGGAQHGSGHIRAAGDIRQLLDLTCKVFGIDVDHSTNESEDAIARVRRRLALHCSVHDSSDITAKIEVLRLCILISEAVSDPVATSQYISLLLLVARRAITMIPLTQNPTPIISLDEQVRLLNGLAGSSKSAQRLNGPSSSGVYWDDFLVRKVTLVEPTASGRLMPRQSQDLKSATASGMTRKDPFIYNPANGQHQIQKAGPSVLVKDETAFFDVVLQNTLETDVEVERIQLVSSEDSFQADAHTVVLAPMTAQTFTFRGRPIATGTLRITGCRAKVRYCREQDFLVHEEPWKAPRILKRRSTKTRDSNSEVVESLVVANPAILELKVIDPLPKLSIIKSSLTQQSLMLLDGQTSTFSITIQNSSSLPADLVLFSYTNSHTSQLQEALATKGLSTAETYELHHELTSTIILKRAHSADVSTQNPNTATIAANETQTFDFEITGHLGLTQAAVLVDYAYLGQPRSEVDGTFHTRRLEYVVHTTVSGSIDIVRCNVLALPHGGERLHMADTVDEHERLDEVKTRLHGREDLVMLQLDVRNLWVRPLKVVFEVDDFDSNCEAHNRKRIGQGEANHEEDKREQLNHAKHENSQHDQADNQKWTVAPTHSLPPTELTRILLPFPRLSIPNSTRAIPTPTLGTEQKQFVVSNTQHQQRDVEIELAHREVFWFRRAVLERVRGRWSEVSGDKIDSEIDGTTNSGGNSNSSSKNTVSTPRTGTVNTHFSFRLTPRMIDTLRREPVQITFTIRPTSATPSNSDFESASTDKQAASLNPQPLSSPHSAIEPSSADPHPEPDSDSDRERDPHPPPPVKIRKNEFYTLRVRIRNSTSQALRLLLRLYPTLHSTSPHHNSTNSNSNSNSTSENREIDLSQRLIFAGNLQIPLRPGLLAAGGVRVIEVGVVSVKKGVYGVNATVEEVCADRSGEDGDGRSRIWYSLWECVVECVEEEEEEE